MFKEVNVFVVLLEGRKKNGRSRPGAALAARVEGGVVGEALADTVASAVGRRGAVGAAPAGVTREAPAGVRRRRRASERRGPRCSGRAATQAVGVERRVVRIALTDVVGAAPRRRGALVVVAAAGVAHETRRGCRGGRRAWRRLAGRYSSSFSPTHVFISARSKPMSTFAGLGRPGSSMSISWFTA